MGYRRVLWHRDLRFSLHRCAVQAISVPKSPRANVSGRGKLSSSGSTPSPRCPFSTGRIGRFGKRELIASSAYRSIKSLLRSLSIAGTIVRFLCCPGTLVAVPDASRMRPIFGPTGDDRFLTNDLPDPPSLALLSDGGFVSHKETIRSLAVVTTGYLHTNGAR